MCIDECKAAGLQPPAGHEWSEYEKSLYEISATEPDANGNVHYCLARLRNKETSKVKAIWFDEVMSHWTDLETRRKNHLPLTRRIDAYYVCGKKKYLIEFKNDGDIEKFKDDFWLKFFDSLTQLIDHRWISLHDAQENLTYIVVRSGRPKQWRKEDFTAEGFSKLPQREKEQVMIYGGASPVTDLVQKPWKYYPSVRPACGLGRFEGVSCQMALTITAAQFDTYAKEHLWK